MRSTLTPTIAAVLLATSVSAQSVAADEIADFYKGKSVNIVVGHEPATGFDIYARVLARHLGRHIPGNPNIVVQNMTGASGLTAANWLYNVAPKDGTVMATFVHTIPFESLMGTARRGSIRQSSLGSATWRRASPSAASPRAPGSRNSTTC
jgi:tripartite-type tricarboxylate transporter receptor subunit TctC